MLFHETYCSPNAWCVVIGDCDLIRCGICAAGNSCYSGLKYIEKFGRKSAEERLTKEVLPMLLERESVAAQSSNRALHDQPHHKAVQDLGYEEAARRAGQQYLEDLLAKERANPDLYPFKDAHH
uniref:Uncharacterized protein n=1 Tax=Ditylenchus dipsaci TaxID=166011 RepID=A0A915CSX4_9BILA